MAAKESMLVATKRPNLGQQLRRLCSNEAKITSSSQKKLRHGQIEQCALQGKNRQSASQAVAWNRHALQVREWHLPMSSCFVRSVSRPVAVQKRL